MAPESRVDRFCRGARSLYRRVSPFACVQDSDLPFEESSLNSELRAQGLPLEEYCIDIEGFSLWKEKTLPLYPSAYIKGYGAYFEEKCLEHYLSLQFAQIDGRSVIIDVANAGSPFPRFASALGATVYQNDILFPEGIRRIDERIYKVGGTACALPFPERFADIMVLHCAFEMFEGDQDSQLIREASRVLKPNGVMVIVPLYLSSSYHILCDLGASRKGCCYDQGARIVYTPGFHGVRFARFYDAAALRRRVKDHAEGMGVRILYCRNAKDLNPDRSTLYLRYLGVFEKR